MVAEECCKSRDQSILIFKSSECRQKNLGMDQNAQNALTALVQKLKLKLTAQCHLTSPFV